MPIEVLMSIWLQNSVSIQKRTSGLKFDHFRWEIPNVTVGKDLRNIWRMTPNCLHRLLETNCKIFEESMTPNYIIDFQKSRERCVVENGKVSNRSGRKWESFKFNIFSTEKMYRERRKTKNEGRRGAIHWGANCHSEQTTQKRSGNFIQIIWLSPILALRYWTRYEK